MSTENKSVGYGLFTLSDMLFVVFLVLKLTHYIDWSWWWVISPLWIGFAIWLLLTVILIVGIMFFKNKF